MKRILLQNINDITKVGQYLRSLEYKKPYIVEIKQYKKSKTDNQRSWFHFLLNVISEETGYETEEVKELIKKRILGTRIITIGDSEVEVTESSEKANREDYSKLIDATYRLAAEAGIVLPDPAYK